jgi:aryl-alcohol dehydrogenase-like predicted oxidoreductase
MDTTRRDFLKTGAAMVGTGAALALGGRVMGQNQDPDVMPENSAMPPTPPSTRKGEMPYRTLGRTGEQVSLIGMGGFHIGKPDSDAEGIALIHSGVDRGINFLDNSWDYNNGNSEVRMGKALAQGGYRQKVFLMTKIDGRTSASFNSQLEQSLTRLQTDHVDLIQFHEIIRMQDPDRIFAKGGALEAAVAAKQAGKVRYIGFTGHKDPLVHRRMLEVADQHGFHFDTVQMPVNVMDAHFRSFTHQMLPLAAQKGIGVLAMKTFGDHFILDRVLAEKLATPTEMLHYSMTMPVSVVITGIDRMEILDQALNAAKTFAPIPPAQMAALLGRTRVAALDGTTELFKTTPHFDSTAQNPAWLG